MATVSINSFSGGHAEDIRTFATDECEKSLNFDIFTNPHYIMPYRDVVTETVSSGVITDFALNGIVYTTQYVTVGRNSAGTAKPTFYSKTDIKDNWQAGSSGAAGSTIINGTLVLYKGVAYCLAYDSTFHVLLINSSGTTKGTNTVATQPATTPKPFVHPEDNCLYFVSSYVIGKLDSTLTYSENSSILPTDFVSTSLTSYGTYLAIAGTTGGKSVVYLWGRDITLNTVQGVIPFGEGTLQVLENIGNDLVGIVNSVGSLANPIVASIDVKVYARGVVQTVKSLTSSSSISASIGIHKSKYNDKVYFGAANDDCLYAVGKSKEGFWIVTKDRFMFNGAVIGSGAPIPTILNGFLWVSFNTAGATGQFYRTTGAPGGESASYSSTTTRRTTINPGMAIADRSQLKQLQAVQISYTGAASGTTALKYSVDGSAFTTIISATNATGEYAVEATAENDGTVFLSGQEFQFQAESSGGAQIKEISYKYSVLNSTI